MTQTYTHVDYIYKLTLQESETVAQAITIIIKPRDLKKKSKNGNELALRNCYQRIIANFVRDKPKLNFFLPNLYKNNPSQLLKLTKELLLNLCQQDVLEQILTSPKSPRHQPTEEGASDSSSTISDSKIPNPSTTPPLIFFPPETTSTNPSSSPHTSSPHTNTTTMPETNKETTTGLTESFEKIFEIRPSKFRGGDESNIQAFLHLSLIHI